MLKHNLVRTSAVVVVAAGSLVAGLLASSGTAMAAAQQFSLANVGNYGGEPSIVSGPTGTLYDSTPSGGLLVYRSTDKGATWTATTTPDPLSGDSCLATDQSTSVYACNLAGTPGAAPLQADVWKSKDQGATWVHGEGAAPPPAAGQCGTSCSLFGVDRQWTAANIAAGKTTDTADVVLMYHDFYGPSQIWVNISHDGGKTFGAPQEVLASPNVSPGGLTGTLTAEGYTFCNTVPAGVGIVPTGRPHAGRIIVGWIAADAAQDASGCNVSQAEGFHTIWVSYSDDNGATWTPQQAFDAGVGHDTSTPFVGMNFDNTGNPYFAFATNHWDPSPATNAANPVQCAALSASGMVQGHQECAYDMYVVWSADQGAHWDHTGSSGTIPGSAAAPYKVNSAAEGGSHWFPAIAAGGPGQVDVSYLRTTEILPTGANGKTLPGGCDGTSADTLNPSTYPPRCDWNLHAAQSLNLTGTPTTATWTLSGAITPAPMHKGDICNLGIACVTPPQEQQDRRDLADFIQETIDPTTGCAHIAYADDNLINKLRVANQTAGCMAITPPAQVAEAPMTVLLIGAGAAVALSAGVARRRRRGAAAPA
jgi:hypothetical protein